MENRALGKGLSALIPDKVDLSKEKAPGNVLFVNTGNIKENSLQPRIHYNKEKLADLEASIKEKGVLQPILVRPKDDGYEVIAGERRLLAARANNLKEVPVIIRDVSDQESLVLALVENIQREELNPIEEANAFRRLIEEFQLTHDEVAQSVGKDRSTISNILRLLKLPEKIQQSVSTGDLSMGHARALVGIEEVTIQSKLFEKTLKKGLSVRELENLIRASLDGISRRKGKKSKTLDPDLAVLQEDLQRILGTKVRIVAQKKRGRIVVEYYSADDLERILAIIKK